MEHTGPAFRAWVAAQPAITTGKRGRAEAPLRRAREARRTVAFHRVVLQFSSISLGRDADLGELNPVSRLRLLRRTRAAHARARVAGMLPRPHGTIGGTLLSPIRASTWG
jgi:hypothetical protein